MRPDRSQPTRIPAAFTVPIMVVCQITVGMLTFQKYVYKEAEHDAWISVLVAGGCAHLSLIFVLKTMKKFQYADMYDIQRQLFGRWIGGLFNWLIIGFWLIISTYILRSYVEILLIWIFPDMSIWVFDLMFFVLIAYGLSGGFQVVAVVNLIHLLLVSWMGLLLFFPLQDADFGQLLPLMEAGPGQLLKGVVQMGATIGGFEIIFYTSSNMKHPERIGRYAHIGLLTVNLLYLVLMLISIGYYSAKQIVQNSWDTLTMLKMIEFSSLQRFEYILIMMWFILVLANLMTVFWVAIQGVVKMLPVKRIYVFAGYCAIQLVITQLLETGDQLNEFAGSLTNLAIFSSYIYPCLIYVSAVVILKLRQRRPGGRGT